MRAFSKFMIPAYCISAFFTVHVSARVQAQKTVNKGDTKTQQFLRVEKSGDDLKALQTAIVRYASQKQPKVSVDLVGAVHIGESKYYETLNALFDDYDVVLYELVAPEGTRIPKGGRKGPATNPLSILQVSAQKFLGLESQLEKVDYSKKHFVHADLSPQQMRAKMRERGDSPLSLAFGAISEMMRDPSFQSKMDDSDTAEITFNDISEMMTDPLKAKRFMARQFAGSGVMEAGLGQSLNQLIVEDRNAAAMNVLDEQIKAGKKKIAIFYGAAHMPDFEQRLSKIDFERKTQSWVTAWDLTQSHAKPQDNPMSMLMQMMNDLGK